MKGTFKITSDYLNELGAGKTMGLEVFKREFPKGGEYQEILDRCRATGDVGFAFWLLSKVGATDDVLVYDEDVEDKDLGIIFAGTVEFKDSASIRRLIVGGDIKAIGYIETMNEIYSGGSIYSDCGVEAGTRIEALSDIKVDFYIYAGSVIRAGKNINAGHDIKAGLDIYAGSDIEAGCGIGATFGIEAGGNILSDRGINAGFGIDAGGEIVAGEDYGISAGSIVPLSKWKTLAQVKAKTKPNNLISGYWCEP